MFLDRAMPAAMPSTAHRGPGPGTDDRTAGTVGILVVRGAGSPPTKRRLPRRSSATIGRRERNALDLTPEWVPRELAVFTPVDDGWLVTNGAQVPVRVENDWVQGGVHFAPGAVVMLQRGEHHLVWDTLEHPVSVSVTVRGRRPEDRRIPFVVDSAVGGQANGMGSYLGVEDAPMSAMLRYRLAVLYQHLILGEPEPAGLLSRRAEFLGTTEADLEWAAQRYRRRLNAVRATHLQTLVELGDYLVKQTGELGPDDLEP